MLDLACLAIAAEEVGAGAEVAVPIVEEQESTSTLPLELRGDSEQTRPAQVLEHLELPTA